MLKRIRNAVDYLRVFPSFGDVRRFREVAYRGGSQQVEVRVRAAGSHALRIRPRTSDAAVLWDTFHEQFHLPPLALRPDAVIFDLGANVGFTALHLAKVHPQARVIAVELDRGNFEVARHHTRELPRVTVVNAAVWSEDGSVSYDSSASEWGFHVENAAKSGASMVTAAAKTMGTLMAEYGVADVDYIKMDIEGAEWPVLSTAGPWLDRVKSMKVELHQKFNENATYENCTRVLEARGFRCSRDDRHWDTLVAVRAGH